MDKDTAVVVCRFDHIAVDKDNRMDKVIVKEVVVDEVAVLLGDYN